MLEHVNLTVRAPEKTALILCEIFGWKVRWQGAAKDGGFTCHVGDDERYLALYAPSSTPQPGAPRANTAIGGLNHIGVVVDDLGAVEQRVKNAGFTPFSHGDYTPGRRFYFLDTDGIEYEVVSYR